MATYLKRLLLCASLVTAGVFSAATVSTPYYYETQYVSGLACQSGALYTEWGQPLGYLPRGAVNRSSDEFAVANCPVTIPESGAYTLNAVVFSRKSSLEGPVECRLVEVDIMSGKQVRSYSTSVYLESDSTGLMTWYEIERTVSESVFSVSCILQPGTGVVSISVAAS